MLTFIASHEVCRRIAVFSIQLTRNPCQTGEPWHLLCHGGKTPANLYVPLAPCAPAGAQSGVQGLSPCSAPDFDAEVSAGSVGEGNDLAFDGLAVDGDVNGRLFAAGMVDDVDVVDAAPELPADGDLRQTSGQTGVDHQTVKLGLHAQNGLRNGEEVPRRGAGQPAVLGFAGQIAFLAVHRLGVDVGLRAVKLLILNVSGRDLLVQFEGRIAVAQYRLGNHDPRIVVGRKRNRFPCIPADSC